jgi:hypothetical protein
LIGAAQETAPIVPGFLGQDQVIAVVQEFFGGGRQTLVRDLSVRCQNGAEQTTGDRFQTRLPDVGIVTADVTPTDFLLPYHVGRPGFDKDLNGRHGINLRCG